MIRLLAILLVLPGAALAADPPSYQDGVIASATKGLRDKTEQLNDRPAGRPVWTVDTEPLAEPVLIAAAPEPVQPPSTVVVATVPPASVTVNAPVPRFDFTPVAVSAVGGVFSILGIVLTTLINTRMKDKQAAETYGTAVRNALGAMQQFSEGVVSSLGPSLEHVAIPGLSPAYAVGVQYVLDHAGEEAARFGATPEVIADKITAQIGLRAIETNQAIGPPPTAPLATSPVKTGPMKGSPA